MSEFREATLEDIDLCIEIIDLNEREFDPDAKSAGPIHVEEILAGYFDEVYSKLLIQDGVATAFINIHGDDVRKTYFPDIYVRPGSSSWEVALLEMESIINGAHSDWRIHLSINGKDDPTKELISRHGYSFMRKYWGMEANIPQKTEFVLPDGIEIRNVDVARDVELWHAAHQDAFSTHFGFEPRPIDKWRELVLGATSLDLNGTYLLRREDRCIGFLESSSELEHEGSGYINTIGVVKSEQGKGYGSLLIKQALHYSATKGFKKVNLNVDTENATSALHVYEKHGFVADFSWERWCKTDREPGL